VNFTSVGTTLWPLWNVTTTAAGRNSDSNFTSASRRRCQPSSDLKLSNNLQRTALLTSLVQYDRNLGQQQLFMVNYAWVFNQLETGKYFEWIINNNYSMSPIWLWSNKITNERVARVGHNHFISNKGEWNNCFSKFSNRVLPPIFISTILQSGKFLNFAHYFPYDVKLRLLAHCRSFLANQKARNAIVGAENLLNEDI